MKPEHQPDNHSDPETREKSETGEILKDVGKDLLRETGTTIKWGIGGALIGAVILGALGFWKFGEVGLVVGAIAGAVLGGAIGFWAYFTA